MEFRTEEDVTEFVGMVLKKYGSIELDNKIDICTEEGRKRKVPPREEDITVVRLPKIARPEDRKCQILREKVLVEAKGGANEQTPERITNKPSSGKRRQATGKRTDAVDRRQALITSLFSPLVATESKSKQEASKPQQ